MDFTGIQLQSVRPEVLILSDYLFPNRINYKHNPEVKDEKE